MHGHALDAIIGHLLKIPTDGHFFPPTKISWIMSSFRSFLFKLHAHKIIIYFSYTFSLYHACNTIFVLLKGFLAYILFKLKENNKISCKKLQDISIKIWTNMLWLNQKIYMVKTNFICWNSNMIWKLILFFYWLFLVHTNVYTFRKR